MAPVISPQLFCVASFGLFCIVHHVMSPLMFRLLSPTYRGLRREIRMEWDSRILSTLHAVVATFISLIILTHETTLWEDPVFGESSIAVYTLAFSSAYMICDLISMNLYWSGFDLYIYYLHHGVSALAFIIGMYQHTLLFFAMYRLVSECSTPFVNMRWFFLTLGVDKGSRRVLTQTFLFAVFFVVSRILTIPVYWYMFYVVAGSPDFYLLLSNFKLASFVWVLSSAVLDSLNVYWLIKIIPKGLTTGIRLFQLIKRVKKSC